MAVDFPCRRNGARDCSVQGVDFVRDCSVQGVDFVLSDIGDGTIPLWLPTAGPELVIDAFVPLPTSVLIGHSPQFAVAAGPAQALVWTQVRRNSQRWCRCARIVLRKARLRPQNSPCFAAKGVPGNGGGP